MNLIDLPRTKSGPVVKTIILQIALNPDEGVAPTRPASGYVITAPLDDDGRLDTGGLIARRWPVRRLGESGSWEMGWLSHRGSAWFIDYDDSNPWEDEAIFRLSGHRLVVGEYLTIISAAGKALTYRVVEVLPTDRAADAI